MTIYVILNTNTEVNVLFGCDLVIVGIMKQITGKRSHILLKMH